MKHKLFSIFLVIYFITIFFHSLEEKGFTSLFLYLGIGLAIFSHAKRNWITILLLFLHMTIEWYEFGNHYMIFNKMVILFLIHVCMDFLFLHHEIRVHLDKNFTIPLMILISTILLVIFLVNFLNHHETHNHEHGGSLHLFALGGVLGCVGSHMYYHIFKEKD